MLCTLTGLWFFLILQIIVSQNAHLQGLCAFLKVAHPPYGLGFFTGIAEAPVNHFAVTPPATTIFGVLET